ncbi:hypothetical protein XaraCFBP7407_21630 [Xanthomonas arboricola pv. arracaciae]|nr:hypothetical protein XaraCFBP7407_21630 [Xanthomonas arboricola pv. arracaciae]
MRRGRSKARAQVARKPCPLAPAGEGLAPFSHRLLPSPTGRSCPKGARGYVGTHMPPLAGVRPRH